MAAAARANEVDPPVECVATLRELSLVVAELSEERAELVVRQQGGVDVRRSHIPSIGVRYGSRERGFARPHQQEGNGDGVPNEDSLVFCDMEAVAMAAAAKRIEIRASDRLELERIVRSRTAEQRMVERAMIVLAAGDGEPAAKIAERVGCSEQTVLRWRARYEQDGLAGLQDLERPGRPLVHGRDVRAQLVALALTRPPDTRQRWTHRELAERVGMSESQVHAILRAADIRRR